MPDELSPEEAGPLLCAGITTFNALRTAAPSAAGGWPCSGSAASAISASSSPSASAIETIAVARGADKSELATQLGAHHYVDSTAGDPGEALQALGGVDLILATATTRARWAALFGGLRPRASC